MRYPCVMDIRKSDDKGRISGFPPNRHFYASGGNGVFHFAAVERMYTIRIPLNDAASEYLESFGLDKCAMKADDHDATGYWRFELDVAGNRMYGTGKSSNPIATWDTWPEGFDYEMFKALSWDA